MTIGIVPLLLAMPLALSAAHTRSAMPEVRKDSGLEAVHRLSRAVMESVDPELDALSASRAVRRGNDLLRAGQPAEALQAYEYARKLDPEAREVTFVQGLAHFDLGEFDKARDAFREVVVLADDSLTDDALYGLGVTDHQEALETLEADPLLALSFLESAMRRYHDVLAKQPDHRRAREANFKAASIWRGLRQRPELRQQREGPGPGASERQRIQDPPKVGEQGHLQKIQQQQRPSREQPKRRPGSDTMGRLAGQQRQDGARVTQQTQVSREQAERRLREMMQAVRDRKKARLQRVQPPPIARVEKDW